MAELWQAADSPADAGRGMTSDNVAEAGVVPREGKADVVVKLLVLLLLCDAPLWREAHTNKMDSDLYHHDISQTVLPFFLVSRLGWV